MKNFYFLFILTIVSSVTYSQTYTWHEVDACTTLTVNNITGTFTESVVNPVTSGINSNANVSQATKGTLRIALNNPIMDTAGQTISLELFSSVAGGNSVGSGLFQVQLQSLNPITTILLGNLSVSADNTWELKTLSLDGKPNAANGYEYLYINAAVNNAAGNDGIFLVDKIKGSLSQEAAFTLGTSSADPALLTGNGWAYDHGSSSLPSTVSYDTNTGSIDTNATNPDVTDNTSSTVLKVTRGDENFESFLLDFPGDLTPSEGGKIKYRVYADYVLDPCDPIAVNVRLSLLSTSAPVDNENMGQKVGPTAVTIKPDVWHEIEVDITSFGAGQQSTEYDTYDLLNVFLGFNDVSSTGVDYYFDAIQLPEAATTLSNESLNISSKLKLYPNPVHDSFIMSEEVESVKIYGVLGNLVESIENKQTKFDVSHLKNGLYFVEVINDNSKEILRFIKK